MAKKTWSEPVLEVLDVKMTAKWPWDPPNWPPGGGGDDPSS